MATHANDKQGRRAMLRQRGLRCTAPRLAVMEILEHADRPLACHEIIAALGDVDWDPATVYRNLQTFKEAGMAAVASQAAGVDRYVWTASDGDSHRHPHFVCQDCGMFACLPEVDPPVHASGAWAPILAQSRVQFQGRCADCAGGASQP